jgi:ubiquinone/menaquinone biosynthesis C-methylase UbiE
MGKEANSSDYALITKRQQETWATGDFHEIARQNVCMAETICETADPHATDQVLDVACGSGTAALVAARRYCEVTGIDYVPELIERAKRLSVAAGLEVDFLVADAQDLPFDDNSFDMVVSVYGVQFAPDQGKAANEMLRVCRSGGKIALATPFAEGWSGDFFSLNAKYMPPPPGVKSPLNWSTNEGLHELLGSGIRAVKSEVRKALQYYRSVDHAANVFLHFFGPTIRTSEALDEKSKGRLRNDLKTVFNRYNRATDGTAVIENQYLLTIATCA